MLTECGEALILKNLRIAMQTIFRHLIYKEKNFCN